MLMSDIVDYFISGLKNKSDDVKLRVAKEFKNYIVNDLKDRNHEEVVLFIETMHREFSRLMNTNEINDKKTVLIAICCIADMDIVFSHNNFSELTKQIVEMSVCNDVQINALRARFIAQLNLIATADKVGNQITESCSIVVDDSKSEAQKIAAALTFKDNSLYASTLFFQHASKVINSLLIGIRDKQASVREACVIALSCSFGVIAMREGIGRRRRKAVVDPASMAVASHRLLTSMTMPPQQQRHQASSLAASISSQQHQYPANHPLRVTDPDAAPSAATPATRTFPDYAEWGENLYSECIKNMLRPLDDANCIPHISSRRLNADAWNHGTLLLLIELLKLSNDEMETNRLKLEEMIGLPLDQLSQPASLPASAAAVRAVCQNSQWPYSNTEQHILQHRPRIFHSHWCRGLMLKHVDKIWPIVLASLESKQSHLSQLALLALPRLIALDIGSGGGSPSFIQQQRLFAFEQLQRCLKRADHRDRPLVFLTLGLIAHVVPVHFESTGHLEKTMAIVRANLPNKDVSAKKRHPLVEMSVYMLIGLIATGCRDRVHDQIKDMIQSMVDAGLSFPLIYSLKMVSCFIQQLTGDIHTTLLKSLRRILMNSSRSVLGSVDMASSSSVGSGSSSVVGAGAGSDSGSLQLASAVLAPIAPANLSPDQLEARNKILALRTLVEFDFDKHNLSLFVRFISSKLISFLHCPYKELRIEAVRTCAQLLTPLLGSEDTMAVSDRNTLNAVADVLEKLLIVSTSDPEPEVRLCVFQSFDERFDAYLAQECHLSPLFIALHDESFEIRKLVIQCLGRLSSINPSCVKPSLRQILLQILNELKNSGSTRGKEQAAHLLAKLIETAPGFIQPHSEQLLLVLLPTIQSIIDAAVLTSSVSVVDSSVSSQSGCSIGARTNDQVNQILVTRGSSSSVGSGRAKIEPSAVQLAVMEAIKNLAVVCGAQLRQHLDQLVPALIYMMQDSSTTLHRRQVAVSTLCGLVSHTGYVVEPYRRHPELLHILLMMMRTEEVDSIRREVIKLLGTIGALDPFKLKVFGSAVDSAEDTGLVVSVHEIVDKKEVDMTQTELLVNVTWSSMDDFYIACTLQSLIQLLRDPAYRAYFDKICYSIMLIFKSLGAKSVQYLRQILPEYFRCITNALDSRQQEVLLSHLCQITDVVRLHLKQFMPDLVSIMRDLWHRSSALSSICISVLRHLNAALGAEIKPFLCPLIADFQYTLTEDAEQTVIKMLELIPEFGYSIEENCHILLPAVVRLISREDGGAHLKVRRAALDCLTRLADKLDLSGMAGRIVQAVCRLLQRHDCSGNSGAAQAAVAAGTGLSSPLFGGSVVHLLTIDQLGELVVPAFDLLTTLLVRMRQRFMVLTQLTQRTMDSVRVHFPPGSVQAQTIVRFITVTNKVLKAHFVSFHEDDLLRDYESMASQSRRKRENSSNSGPEMTTALTAVSTASAVGSAVSPGSIHLSQFWGDNCASRLISSEDWQQWLRNLCHALVRQSPCGPLRLACTNIGGACSASLSHQLFNVAFVSCWPQLSEHQQDNLVLILETVIGDSSPSTEVSQAVLNLEEFMSRCDRMKLPISTAALAARALKNRVYAKALYYKEQEFLEETAKKGVAPQNLLFELLTINQKLQLEEAASGTVLFATRVHKDKLAYEERWHERMHDWMRALNLYERKLEDLENRRQPNTDLVLGRMRCLQALGDWSTLKSIGSEPQHQMQHVTELERMKMAPILVNSAWALGDFAGMSRLVETIPATGSFDGAFLRAVVAVHYENFHEATECIQRARAELDSCLTAMAGESYIRAYNDLVEAQKLAELEEVMQYKLVRESQDTIRRAWIDRLAGCQENIDDWRQLLQIRSLVLSPQQLAGSWLKFAGLARRSGRTELSRVVIETLWSLTNSPTAAVSSTRDEAMRVQFALAKYSWAVNKTDKAQDMLEKLVNEVASVRHRYHDNGGVGGVAVVEDLSQDKQTRLLFAKCTLKLGQWYSEMQIRDLDSGKYRHSSNRYNESQKRIIATYRIATEEAPWLPRAWQAWAMANYVSICQAKARLMEVNKEMGAVARQWRHLQTRSLPQQPQQLQARQLHKQPQPPIAGTANSATNQLPPDVLRMAQPQLRFSLLQAHQKRGYQTVYFPSQAPQIPDSLSTFGPAAAVMHSQQQLQSVSPGSSSTMSTPVLLEGSAAVHHHHPAQFSVESCVLDPAAAQQQLVRHFLQLEKQRQHLATQRDCHSLPAVRGFVNAISLCSAATADSTPASNLQDSLRLVILLFQFGHLAPIREVIRDGLTKIRLENWLLVIQQLLARIDTQKEHVAGIIVGLLISVAERHPQAMISPLVLAFKSGGSDRRRYNANKILHSMETHSAKLVAEGFMLNEELIRLAISWMEMWTECLEDASRLYYEDKNVVAMFKLLHPLHLLMDCSHKTLQEAAFYTDYCQDLNSARTLCIRYESSNYKTDLTQAWEIYSNLYRKWSKQISNVSMIELNVASPRLHEYRDWSLAIPGSYQPHQAAAHPSSSSGVVTIETVRNCLSMMTSKQHPRKLTLLGSDGHNYLFLLKGHEDIRQDERAMQFFGLINTHLVADPLTHRRNLSIQRMSVIPLSTNTGLIGWVPNSDTLNALIRDYREKTGVLLNREHKEMLKIAPDFEKLNIIQKTEVFEAGMHESDGKDLAHILWLKSHNSETWFERRSNFIRSLAVMSMVGYVLGLGDRHPSNIMLCRQSGKVIHIDFGDCFEVATMREKYPEKVPFRLTRMLIGAMEVTGMDGVFRQTCVQLVRLMRRNRESLLAVLEAFIHDPLLQWVLHDNNNAGAATARRHQQPQQRATDSGANDLTDSSLPEPPGTASNGTLGFENTNSDATASAVYELRKALKLLPPNHHQQQQQQHHASRPNLVRQSSQTAATADSSTLLTSAVQSGASSALKIFTDTNYPDSGTLRNPFSVNQWRHHLCNGPWLGCYNTALGMRKRAPDGSIVVDRKGLEGLIFSARPGPVDDSNSDDFEEDERAGANVRAMDVMTHIQNKLEGKEAGSILSAEDHVDMLIKQATSNYNLCQMYFGWCAFW